MAKHKPGYIYRFHRHQPGSNEPRAQQSPHVSPSTLAVARMPDNDLVPSANYYPPTWDAHPMLPPGTIGATPRASAVATPPAAQTPMSAKSTPSPPGGEPARQPGGNDGEGGTGLMSWMCCVGKKVERAVHVAPPRPGEHAMV